MATTTTATTAATPMAATTAEPAAVTLSAKMVSVMVKSAVVKSRSYPTVVVVMVARAVILKATARRGCATQGTPDQTEDEYANKGQEHEAESGRHAEGWVFITHPVGWIRHLVHRSLPDWWNGFYGA